VLDREIDRFLSAARAQLIQAPTRSGRNRYVSADATARTWPETDLGEHAVDRRGRVDSGH
jgi:hypothetical protein